MKHRFVVAAVYDRRLQTATALTERRYKRLAEISK
jgi:hypothetical protein